MKLIRVSLVLALLAVTLWFATRRPSPSSQSSDIPPTSSISSDVGQGITPKPVDSSERHIIDGANLRIVVATKDDSQPVAHARVLVAKSGIDPQTWKDEAARYGSMESALAHGLADSHETDEHGELLIPLIDGTRMACAWRDDLFGKTDIAPGAHDALIEVSHARTLDIDVVDASGAAVPNVCITSLAIAGTEWESVGDAWTDANGRVHVDDLDDWRWHDNKTWRIGAAYGASQPEFMDVSDPIPSSPFRFVLGATGTVELALADANGQPLATEAEFGLYVDDGRMVPSRGLEPDGWHSRFTKDGRALFEHVALDLPLAVHVWAMGFDIDEPKDLRGPSLPNETRRIELRCKSVRPIVRGRVVDSSGRPLSGAHLVAKETSDLEIKEFADASQAFDTSTHDDGTFEEALDRRAQRPDLPPLVIAANDANRPTYIAHVPSPSLSPPSRPGFPPHFELGTLIAEPLPFLAGGVVVDSKGRPVPRAHVDARGADDAWPLQVPPFGVDCTSDELGRFTVSGLTQATHIELRAQQYDRGKSEPLVVEVGATAARLVLDGRGRISGRLILPEDVSIDDLGLVFSGKAEGGADDSRQSSGYEMYPENGFVTAPIAPGRWSLAIYLGSGSEILPRREGIVVEAGGSVDLGEVDLRPCFRSLGIEIVDERGSPIESSQWDLFDSKGDLVGDRSVSSAAHPRISVPLRATRACVNAKGFRTQGFDDLRDGATWTMRKSHEVRLRWPTTLPRIEAPLQLFVRTRFSGESTLANCARAVARRLEAPIEPGSEISIDVSISGKWIVTFDLIDKSNGDGIPIDLRPAQVLDVADLEAPQVFTIEVDASILSRAIAEVHPR